MAYENFTTYDETDEKSNVTVTSNKVSWIALDRDDTAHVSDSKGAAHFNDDFEHLFEFQASVDENRPYMAFWALANSQLDIKALIDASADFVCFLLVDGNVVRLSIYENGVLGDYEAIGFTLGTTYYVTLSYDRDGGANSTGQYVAVIRTGSHSGDTYTTLTADCAVGEQNDFEYIFGMASWDDNTGAQNTTGFTQNLDLQEIPAGAAGAMTENTGFWGQIVGE